MSPADPDFDPAKLALLANPEPVLGPLRDQFPLFQATIGQQRFWVLSRHADVKRVLEHPSALMRPPGASTPPSLGAGPAARMWKNALSMMDPPDHTRVRRLVGRAFTRRRAEDLRPGIEAVVAEIFRGLDDRDQIEVVNELALQVPMRVICGLLGIPDEDWPMLQSWTPDFLRIFLPDAASPDDRQRLDRASQNFIEYFGAMIDARLETPREDLTTGLVALQEEGGMTRDELIGALRGLLTAGFETSAATISAAFLGFAREPAQLDLLRARPDLVPQAVEELLRWESPVRAHLRYLGADMELHGRQIPAGAAMWMLVGAANHDPLRFRDPARIDVARAENDHLAFGGGRHFCLGAYLSRVELQSVFARLARRWSRIAVVEGTARRRPNFQFPGLERLVVRLR